jgi:hypothetical protein
VGDLHLLFFASFLAHSELVNRVILTGYQPLPVYPDQRTSSDRPGWSGSCHDRKWPRPIARRPDEDYSLKSSGNIVMKMVTSTIARALHGPR